MPLGSISGQLPNERFIDADQYILRFDVCVYDTALGVQIIEAFENLHCCWCRRRRRCCRQHRHWRGYVRRRKHKEKREQQKNKNNKKDKYQKDRETLLLQLE